MSMATWYHETGDKYHVTGVDRDGKRFKPMVYDNYHYASAINLWRGSVWLVRNGKRHLVKRVWN